MALLEGMTLRKFSYGPWRIVLRVIARNKDQRGTPSLGTLVSAKQPLDFGSRADNIHEVLRKKTSKYGAPDAPYLLCLNVLRGLNQPREEILEVLYGRPVDGRISARTNGFLGPTRPGRPDP